MKELKKHSVDDLASENESPASASCKDNCGVENLISREARGDHDDDPMIHYGLIASSDKLMKDATVRDKLAMEEGVLCFEMEAAGLMNHFPCLIIRGICDYADSHKNKQWQGFAAMTAAAYVKELLQKILPTNIQHQKPLTKVLGEIGMKLENITTSVEDTNATVNTMHADNRRLEIERWLKPPGSSTNVAKAKKRRHDGTGQWFMQSPAFTEFKAGSRMHLWLHGLAGCGKTVLSSQILDDLSTMNGIITLVHYFDFNDVEKQSLDGLLRSLAFQLYQHGGQDASAKLHELFKICGNGVRHPGEWQLESCIKSMLSTADRVFILIDALDECKSRDSLFSWIGRFTVENVQLFLTVRPDEDIQSQVVRSFGKENCFSLDKTAVNNDIKSYVRFVLDTNPRFMDNGLSEELRNEICTKVGDGADGTFRWAACQMDTLETCLTPNAVREALNSLPHDLPMTYERMLESIPPRYKSDSIRLLQFIVSCEQPLSLAEVVEILATRPDQYQDRLKFDPQDRLFRPLNIVRYCPDMIHIVLVTNDELYEGSPFQCEEVHLTHFSVKEYLTERESSFSPLECAITITETSFAYLDDVKGPFYRMSADYPLTIRAEDIWPASARTAQSASRIVEQTAAFLLDPENLSKCNRISQLMADAWNKPTGRLLWTGKRPIYCRSWERVWEGESAFSYACRIGLHEIVKYMMEDYQLKVRDQEKEFCLVNAIRGKHSQVAELLLEHGVSADTSHPEYGLTICNASELGLGKIVRKLIEAGANVNRDRPSEQACCSPALCAAVQKGHLKIVKDLLEAGAHFRIDESLRLALMNGQTAIIELLAEHALKSRPIVIASELLESAASQSTIELVRRLLDTKPSLLCIPRALLGACKAGRTEIAQLLIQYAKADHQATELEVWVRRPSPGTCIRLKCPEDIKSSLFPAVNSGNEDLVQMLLDNVVDLSRVVDLRQDSKDPATMYAQKAFSMALEGCHQIVINTILDAMVNHAHTHDYATLRAASEVHNHHILRNFSIASKNRQVTTPFSDIMNLLYEVFLGDHKQIFQSLLKEAGRDYFRLEPKAQLWDFHAPIEVAAAIGSADIVAQLIQAEIIPKVNEALDLAVKYGREHVARILLDDMVDMNLTMNRSEIGPSRYFIRCAGRDDSLVPMFLDHGIDYNCSYWDGSTLLHGAAEHGNVNLVEKLLSLGHPVDPEKGHYCTPLHIASSIDVKRVLLAAGANVNTFNEDGLTPLHTAAQRGAIEEMELLLQFGASISALTEKGLTVVDKALCYEKSSDSTVLRTTKFLLDRGLGVNDRNEQGAAPLHYACVGFRVGAAMLLIKKGADVNAKDFLGETPFRCVLSGHVSKATVDILSLLVDNGADLNSTDYEGFTALHRIGLASDKWYYRDDPYRHILADMAELLLDYGVDIEARDNEGKTVLYWFFKHGDLAAAELFINRGADIKALSDLQYEKSTDEKVIPIGKGGGSLQCEKWSK
ncbi:hypothetical protein H9Q70_006664 [Fusarium xylarioides]|nr:hypothetical protein H9Q70_006664 [Fusarium xylarioides]KAG5779292.1 hypothetical protein H9Q73_007037 [Fusarium xylarioides]